MSAEKKIAKTINGFNGLTKRWFIQTTIIVIAFLLVICVVGAYIVHSYYYNSVDRRMLNYSNSAVDTYFESFSSDDATFEKGARSFVYDFKDKATVEVWVIDKYGNVLTAFCSDYDFQPMYLPGDYDQEYPTGYFKYYVYGRKGIINGEGQIVIPAIYNEINQLDEHLFEAQMGYDGPWRVIKIK